MPQTVAAVEVDDQPGAADGAGPVDVAGADQPTIGRARRPGWRRSPCSGRCPGRCGPATAGRSRAGGAGPVRGCCDGRWPGRPACAGVPASGRIDGARRSCPTPSSVASICRSRKQIISATPPGSRSQRCGLPKCNTRATTRISSVTRRSVTGVAMVPPMTTLVAGVDTSTQACKVVVRDAATGDLVRAGRASHPAGTSVAPRAWAEAFRVRRGGRRRPGRRGGALRRAASSTAWSASTRTAPSSATHCSGTTSGPPVRRPT